MPEQMHPKERAARQYNRDKQELAGLMAAQMPPGQHAVRYEAKDERRAFWQRDPAMTPEAEQGLWIGMIGKLMHDDPTLPYIKAARMATPHVAMAVYPARVGLIRSGARGLSVNEQIKFSDRMEKLGPPGEEEDDG